MAIIAGNNDAERQRMKHVFMGGAVILTGSLAIMNVWGAWVGTGLYPYASLALGAEIMLFVAVGLAVLSRTWLRKGVSALVIAGLTYFCVENGKYALEHAFSDLLGSDSATLEQQADMIELQIPALEAAQGDAEAADAVTLADIRSDIAKLEAERVLMASQSPEKIGEAQALLIASGDYFGKVDGIRGELTEKAMRARGEEIGNELEILKNRERHLLQAATTGTAITSLGDIGTGQIALTPAMQAKASAIALRERAKRVEYRRKWAERILWIVEAARSFGVWAFIMTSTAAGTAAAFAAAGTGKPEDDLEGKPIFTAGAGAGAGLDADTLDAKPEPTQAQLNGAKGAEARHIYAEAEKHSMLRVPPILSVDQAETEAGE